MLLRRQTKAEKASPELTNYQLVVLAAFLVGAQSSSADTEDIAVKANELAPGRFSWRKYKEQINIDTVRKRLWDATKPENGGYLIGSEKAGWRLTKAGYDFAQKRAAAGPIVQTKRARASQVERATQTREINRMMGEPALRKFFDGRGDAVTKSEAERFFRIDDYVTGKARSAKIERFRIMVAGDKILTKAVESLAALLKEN